jgi:hypothetical protein
MTIRAVNETGTSVKKKNSSWLVWPSETRVSQVADTSIAPEAAREETEKKGR